MLSRRKLERKSMFSPDIAGMMDKAKVIDRAREEQAEALLDIYKMKKKLLSTAEVVEKPGDSVSTLKMLLILGIELSESEISNSNQLIGQVDEMFPPGAAGQQRGSIEGRKQKKKRKKGDYDVPRISPSTRNQLNFFASLKGEQVAGRVAQEGGDKDEWVIVKVTHYDEEMKEFEVLDEEPGDDEEAGVQRKYKLPWSHILPFPKRNDPEMAPEFPPGEQVLAVYPETTALYKATVVQTRKRKTENYTLEFDDDEEEDGYLPQRSVPFDRVVALPDGYSQ